MPSQLSDGDIDAIIEEYQDTGNMKTVASNLSRGTATVSKYVNKWKDGTLPERYDGQFVEKSIGYEEDEDDATGGPAPEPSNDTSTDHRQAMREQEDEEDETPDGWTAPPPEDAKPEDDGEPDFEEMDEGDFISWFFETRGHGVRGAFAKNLADLCRVRKQLPDEHEMANRILSNKSGISKEADASMIAETYWAAAERFLRANNQMQRHQQTPGLARGGDWHQTQPQQSASPDGGGGGQWLSANTGPQQHGGQQQFENGQNHRQQPQQQNHQPQQQQQNDEIREEMDELKRSVKTLAKSVSSNQNQQQSRGKKPAEQTQTIAEQMQQLRELQSIVQDMGNQQDDGEDPQVQALKDEMQNIKQEMVRQQQEAAEADSGPNPADMGEMGMIAQLASKDDIDPEMIGILAESMGNTDPDVRKKELEVEKENKKTERQRQIVSEVFDGLREVPGEALAGLISNLGGGGNQQKQNQRAPQQQQQQQQQQSPEQGYTEPGPGSVGPKSQSPTRQKHQDRLRQQNQQPQQDDTELSVAEGEPEDELGGFRGPGGGDGIDTSSMVDERVNEVADESGD